MKQKFIQDFFDAHHVDKEITLGMRSIVDGTFVLLDMLQYIRKDIAVMDQEAKAQLELAIKKMDADNKKIKEEIIANTTPPEDKTEETEIMIKLLRKDHKRYRKELFWIQDMAFKKGWFD